MIIEAFKNKIFPLKDPTSFLEYGSEKIHYREVLLVVTVKMSYQNKMMSFIKQFIM